MVYCVLWRVLVGDDDNGVTMIRVVRGGGFFSILFCRCCLYIERRPSQHNLFYVCISIHTIKIKPLQEQHCEKGMCRTIKKN